jgi:FtsP/CotA-like multicopper oxidase with cupredoxin domain
MNDFTNSRRGFFRTTGAIARAFLLSPRGILARTEELTQHSEPAVPQSESAVVDYTLRIETSPVEIAPKRIISITTYNGQFPGPLLRFKEGQQVMVDVFNDTDTPEQLHWHGQKIPTEVDGASEEERRLFLRMASGALYSRPGRQACGSITPTTAPAQISRLEQYSGRVGPVYIEPRQESGR